MKGKCHALGRSSLPRGEVFAAGDHRHAESEEASELIAFVLGKCGYTKQIGWECRIDKMRHCSAESRVFKVIGWKTFGVALRVKPTANATHDQQMTLMIPSGSGYSAQNVFEQLKGVEKTITRSWRQEMIKKKNAIQLPWMRQTINQLPRPIPPICGPMVQGPLMQLPLQKELPLTKPPQETPEGPFPLPEPKTVLSVEVLPKPDLLVFDDLKGVVKNKAKLQFVLEKVKVLETHLFFAKMDYIRKIIPLLGWGNFIERICSRVFSEIEKAGYVEPKFRGEKVVCFQLTEKGVAFLSGKEVVSPVSPVVPNKQTPPAKVLTSSDFASALVNIHERAQKIADAGRQLLENAAQRAELKQKLLNLDEEDQKLLQVVTQNQEAYDVLNKLALVVEKK